MQHSVPSASVLEAMLRGGPLRLDTALDDVAERSLKRGGSGTWMAFLPNTTPRALGDLAVRKLERIERRRQLLRAEAENGYGTALTTSGT